MCSDGLTNMVADEQIADIVFSDGNLKEKAQALIDTANQQGGRDNIAVILIDPQIREVKAC